LLSARLFLLKVRTGSHNGELEQEDGELEQEDGEL